MATITNNDDDDLKRVFDGQAHESHHKDQIDPAFETNDSIKYGRNVLESVTDNINYLDDLRATRLPTDTPAAHAKKVEKAVDDAHRNLVTSYTNASTSIKNEAKRVDAELDATANLKANPRFEAAILARFQQMNAADHAGSIDKMIDAGDTASLATLIEAPAVVTGLDPALRDTVREKVLRKVAPQQLALRTALLKAAEKLNTSFMRSLRDFDALKSGCDRFDAKIAAAEAVANKARSGFSA